MAGESEVVGALGAIIFAGLLGRLFLRKTGLSDVFLLILLGVCVGALLPAGLVNSGAPLLLPLGSIALFMIILEEGLHLPYDQLKRNAHKALVFGVFSFASCFALTFLLCYTVFAFDFFFSLIVASLFAGVAPELLSGFLKGLSATENTKSVGQIEATITDALSVMLCLVFIEVAKGSGTFLPSEIWMDIVLMVFLSAAVGSAFALIWKFLVSRLAQENEHLFAVGVSAILYLVSELGGANGIISVFVFGFFLGNMNHHSVAETKKFQSQIGFFLRTFFFVYIGMMLFHSEMVPEVAAMAAAISLIVASARVVAGKIACILEPSARRGRLLELVSSRGLTAAVLSVVAAQELSHAGIIAPVDLPLLALFVVFITNAISAWLVFRKRGRMEEVEAQY